MGPTLYAPQFLGFFLCTISRGPFVKEDNQGFPVRKREMVSLLASLTTFPSGPVIRTYPRG